MNRFSLSLNTLHPSLVVALRQFAAALVFGLAAPVAFAAGGTGSTIPLTDSPLFSPSAVPGNVLLTLSVEYPTALSEGNPYAFSPSTTTYIGYFDPNLCYTYIYDSSVSSTNYYSETGDDGDYFAPSSRAGLNGTCTNQWSGSYLNWATMQTIDPFRWALTGGYRSVDTAGRTILKKAWASGDGGNGEFLNSGSFGSNYYGGGNRQIPLSVDMTQYTPFGVTAFATRIWGLGTRMEFTSIGVFNGTNQTTTDTPWNGNTNALSGLNALLLPNALTVFSLKVRVLACDNSFDSTYSWPAGSTTTCTQYSGANKPEGLIQEYSTPMTTGAPPMIRFGAMGYLNDGSIYRDAGVLRARMNFLGPIAPTPGNPTATNTLAEWSATTGVYTDSSSPGGPDPVDVAATNGAATCTTVNALGATVTVPCAAHSGVVAYLNGFGEITHAYKTYDPVNELYYAAIRYFKADTAHGGGNVAAWSCLTAAACTAASPSYTGSSFSTAQAYKMADQFPVIGADGNGWDDPIIYACQKNYILGIGDVNAHAGGNIGGSPKGSQPQNTTSYEPPTPNEVTNDVSIDANNSSNPLPTAGNGAVAATNYVGKIEGLNSALGSINVPWCCGDDNTYLMAGLAYDSHVNDMRPYDFTSAANEDGSGNKIATQTVTTYWLDVQENQTYRYQNMFWLAAKYGGFVLPAKNNPSYTYTPYQIDAFPTTSWTHGSDSGQPGGAGKPMPDNYYGASNAQSMVAGLTSAFASIAAGNATTTTGLVASNYNPVGTSFGSYAVQYDPSDWTSTVNAYTTSFDENGNAISTALWGPGPGSKGIVSGYFTNATPKVFVPGQFTSSGWDSNRFIATYNGVAGVPFRIAGSPGHVTGISATQQASLLKVLGTTYALGGPVLTAPLRVLDYLRGDQCDEQNVIVQYCASPPTDSVGFRSRDFLEGDVIDSQLVPIGPPSQAYTEINDAGYTAFVNTYASRKTVLYVGANDGMMHAFDGSLTPYPSGTGGTELFAYVPSATFLGPTGTATDAGLVALGDPAFIHHNYVDATPIVADLDTTRVNLNGGAAPTSHNWISLLVGGMGKGGRSYYALNVSNPASLTSEAALANAVEWEFSDPAMGYTYGPALVAKTAYYGWTVFLTSGMNAPTDNSNGKGTFYLVNPATGKLYTGAAITTPYGSTSTPAGLSYAGGLTNEYDGTTDAIYAGDLLGNVWRLDVNGSATPSTANLIRIAILTDSLGNAQPVTSPPTVAVDPSTLNRYILIGTGQLLSSADLTTKTQQTFYSLQDGTATTFAPDSSFTGTGTTGPIIRSQLSSVNLGGVTYAQSVCGVGATLAGASFTGANSGARGWRFDLSPQGSGVVTCRVNIASLPGVGGTITFAANLPAGDICNPSGTNEVFTLLDSDGAPQNIVATTTVNAQGNTVTTFSATSFGTTLSGGIVQNLGTYNSNGTLQTLGTTQQTSGQNIPQAPVPDKQLNRLNWREVPATD